VALNQRVLVLGGEGSAGTFKENEAYDPATDSWTALAHLPTPRHGRGVALVNDTVYVPAGAPVTGGSRQSAFLEAFALR